MTFEIMPLPATSSAGLSRSSEAWPGTRYGLIAAGKISLRLNVCTAARETSPIFQEEGIAHSRFLIRAADSAMEQNFVLGRGPWIDAELSLAKSLGCPSE